MEIFGVTLPLWVFFAGLLIAFIILWKFIKFALKLLIILVVFFVILIGLDILGVFTMLQDLFYNFI